MRRIDLFVSIDKKYFNIEHNELKMLANVQLKQCFFLVLQISSLFIMTYFLPRIRVYLSFLILFCIITFLINIGRSKIHVSITLGYLRGIECMNSQKQEIFWEVPNQLLNFYRILQCRNHCKSVFSFYKIISD